MPVSAATTVSRLAAAQRGVLTTAQARAQGVTRVQLARLADKGLLERQGHGVYAMASAAGDEHLDLRAAWLSLVPSLTAEQRLGDPTTGVISHASAAGLHRLGDLLDDEHYVTFPTRHQTRREGVRIHRAALTAEDVTLVDGLPVTTPARTVVDLLRAGTDRALVAEMVADGLGRGLVDDADLATHLDPLARRHGEPNGRALLDAMLDTVGLSPAALARALARTEVGRRIAADVTERLRAEISRTFSGTVDLSRLDVALSSIEVSDLTPARDLLARSRLQEALRQASAAATSRVASSVDWSQVGEPARAAVRRVVEASPDVPDAEVSAPAAADAPQEPGAATSSEETS